ncbi:tRNA glutamyl-Q(34) synthetase GluQRS [Hahella sp. CCB-MM4]|uniref:tRNA glutamyl-Q(34) synthetase GluQRS n=1 Tax=Hahella sp. (strain CCB-MM4) TaxID=1926491 RepID=UPI000B9B056F|nr:tRNA glutamyl-Q(34) synthetase GluQRS [Hahella sp. CCB-MM4]OZG70050.1 tRNA glutamyl-Q(34) synthetase GluQRS [Hahella sp. CCB-MM4]
MPASKPVYRGRFAPSPTGLLHFGSLVGAVASYLDAKSHQGYWLVRIEDIDPLREQAGASDAILRSLEAHHLYWDEKVTFQSHHQERYEFQLQQLRQKKLIYACPCSRKQLHANHGLHLDVCRNRKVAFVENVAIRFGVSNQNEGYHDLIQGPTTYHLRQEIDDFVVKRKEGFYAYQLAVVCDDVAQGITHVIRGIDLVDSTPLQLQLYRGLDTRPPAFGHFPVVVTDDGSKLSKQKLSPALNPQTVTQNLTLAGAALRLIDKDEQTPDKPEELLQWMVSRWSRSPLKGIKQLPSPFTASQQTVN